MGKHLIVRVKLTNNKIKNNNKREVVDFLDLYFSLVNWNRKAIRKNTIYPRKKKRIMLSRNYVSQIIKWHLDTIYVSKKIYVSRKKKNFQKKKKIFLHVFYLSFFFFYKNFFLKNFIFYFFLLLLLVT